MDAYTLMDFQRQTAINYNYQAWKSQDIFNITPTVFVLKKNVFHLECLEVE